jgi:hypothetical protein
MRDEELREQLAAWAQPVERLPVPDITILRHRARRRRTHHAAVGLIACAVVAATAGALWANLPREGRPAAHTSPPHRITTLGPTKRPTSPKPTPTPSPGVADLRLVGANGATAWQLTATSLSVSQNAGQRWSTVPLPAGVVLSPTTPVAAAAGRGLWLAVWRSPAIDLYHRDAGAAGWSRLTLVPQLPPWGAFLAGQLPSVSITLAPADVMSVVADWGVTSTEDYSSLFISSDDGAAFAQHPTNIPVNLRSETFVSAQQSIAIAGPVANFLYWTGDGGASWSRVTIPGLPSGRSVTNVSYGTPGVDGTQLLLPVIVTSSDGAQSISVYRSTDAGAAFAGPTGPPLQIPASLNAGSVAPAITGNLIWLSARGRIYESTDAGATWTTVTTAQSASPISLISPSYAIGIATDSGCRLGYSECYNYTYLVATTNGGRTWRTL